MRGCEVSRRSVRGYQAAVCVHVDSQSGCFVVDEADFALERERVGTSSSFVYLLEMGYSMLVY